MKTTTKKPKAIKRFATWNDLKERCDAGDEQSQRCVIGALENLGGEGLADQVDRGNIAKWERYWRGLQSYMGSLVGEYNMSEAKVERDVLAEINNARTYSDDVDLEHAAIVAKLDEQLGRAASVAVGESLIRSCSSEFLRVYVIASSGAAPWDADRAAACRAPKADLMAAVRQVWIDRLLVAELIGIARLAFENVELTGDELDDADPSPLVEARRRVEEIAGQRWEEKGGAA
jgi:hypothetical protein